MEWVRDLLFATGAFFCASNIYLALFRAPLHRLMGGRPDDLRHVSGAPMIGSLFALAGLPAVWHIPWLKVLGILLILFDFGGIHWFLGFMAWAYVFRRDDG